MSRDDELIVIFGVLHLVALAFGTILFVMFLRSDTPDDGPPHDEDDGGGGGGNDRVDDGPRRTPPGGLPLPDAEPARVRLRGHERLVGAHGPPARRRVAEPGPARRRIRER